MTVKRFLSIGECMVELAPTDQPNTYTRGFAGDTFNTAWYMRQTGGETWRVGYLTAVGDDATSGAFADFVTTAGIDGQHIQVLPGRAMGLYMIHLKDGERSFSYWRGQSAARALAQDAAVLHAATLAADVVYLSGITLGILGDTGRAHLRAALEMTSAQVAFDPNIRPALWANRDQMRSTLEDFAAVSDIVLPSFDDETDHFGDTDPQATVARYLGCGAGMVVVKNAAHGILAQTRDGHRAVFHPQPVDAPVDTTAAGDSFNAGFLAVWGQEPDLDAALRSGAQVARRVISARGALVTL